MRKSILIGVLAALMLFAFTACENGAPTSPYAGKVAEGVTPVSVPVYIIDVDTINPAEVKLAVEFNDGTSVEFTGAELGMTASEIKAATTTVDVKFGGITFYVNIPAVKATATVDASGAVQTTVALPAASAASKEVSISLEGVKAAYVYEGGERAIDLSKATAKVDLDGKQKGEKVTVDTISNGSQTLAVKDWTLEVVEAPAVTAKVEINQDPEHELFYVGTKTGINNAVLIGTVTYSDSTAPVTFTTESNYSGDEGYVQAVLTDVNKVYTTRASNWTVMLTDLTSDYKLSENEKSVNVHADIISPEGVTVAENVPFTIAAIDDYATVVTVAVKTEKGEEDKDVPVVTEWAWGEDVEVENFEFTATDWASDETYTSEAMKEKAPTVSQTEWTPSVETILYETDTKKNLPLSFTYNLDRGTSTKAPLTAELTGGIKIVEKHAAEEA